MSLQDRLVAAVQAIGTDIKALQQAAPGGGAGGPFTVVNLTGTRTLTAGDLNAMVEKSVTGSFSVTVPAGLGEPGDAILFVNNSTSGNVTIARGSGVTIYSYGSNANIVFGSRRSVLIVRTTSNNVWVRG